MSKNQWEGIGKKAGWLRQSKLFDNNTCPGCENAIGLDEKNIVSVRGERWHKICYKEEQRIQRLQGDQDRDYDPQS